MEKVQEDTQYLITPEGSSILQKLQSSIDYVRCVRRKNSDSPKKLEIKLSSSYILKDRALEFSSLTDPTPITPFIKLQSLTRPGLGSQFSTKVQFVKPMQITEEDSPRSASSQREKLNVEIDEDISSPGTSEILSNIDKNLEFSQPMSPVKPKSCGLEREILVKAKSEIQELRQNKARLQGKLNLLEESLQKLGEIDEEGASTLSSIEQKLEKLENQQLAPEEDGRLPEAMHKISNLESEIIKLKSLKDSSVVEYEEELKIVYHKLKDLHECNEILSEMVACFRKEPIFSSREMHNEETYTDNLALDTIGTIKLSGLLNSESILQEAHAKRELLQEIKEKLEQEYKSIPDDSKSMISKRRKLALEFELSMNYSQLVSITNKIKRYTSS